jgi:uncharacterized protein YecT (DUF1311 family)
MRRSTLLLIVALVVVSTATFFIGRSERSGPASSTTTTTATAPLRVPDVHEDFTLLPCGKATTLGLEGCAEHQVLTLDRRIDQLQQAVFQRLPAVTAERDFVRAANEWVVYRRLTCLGAAAAYQSRTLAPVSYADCLVQVDRHRVDDLTALQADFSESS